MIKTRHVWLVLFGSGLVLVVAGGLVVRHRWQRLAAQVWKVPELPRPDLSGAPDELQQRIAAAQAALRTGDNPAAALAELGRLYQANDFILPAAACWQALLARDPQNGRWPYYLAHTSRATSDYAAMEEWLKRAMALAPDYAPAWLQLADLQLKTGRLDLARANYERRLSLVPRDSYARLGLVRIALQQQRPADARAGLEQLLADDPQFSTAHNLYAEILAAEGREADAAYHRLAGRETGRFREADDPWIAELQPYCYDYAKLCNLATIAQQIQTGDRGAGLLERAIKLRPHEATAYEQLGALYLQLNRPADARAVLEHGLAQATESPPSILFYVNLSRAHRSLKQPTEAVRAARQGIAKLGDQFELYDALGTALGDLGDKLAAVDALRKAVELSPGDANANYNLALALVGIRRLDEAVAALHRSLSQQPTFPSSLAMLGQIEIDSGRWQNAVQYARPLYESHPEMPQGRQMMAYWHLRSGMEAEEEKDLASAEEHYRAGTAIEPNHPELPARLGTLYLIQGRFADALPSLEAYRRLQPDNPQGALFLGQAYAATGRMDDAKKTLRDGVALAERTGNAATAQYCREILQQLR